MKKRGLLLFVGVLMFCLSLLAACNREVLPVPTNIHVIEVNFEKVLVWDEVEYSTGGYLVEINGEIFECEYNELNLSEFVTGHYTVRIKALTIDDNYFKNSAWSEAKDFYFEIESGIEYRLINAGTEYEVASFLPSDKLKEVIIFETYRGKPITSIGASAFTGLGSSSITKVTIGSNVTAIGDSAFAGCGRLESVILPLGLKTIGARAFERCRSLSSIEIPPTVASIGERVFEGCHALTSIEIPDSITEIPKSAFSECKALTEINLGNSITTIGESAFYTCFALESIVIPNSVITIQTKAFYNAIKLRNVNLSNKLEKIEAFAFEKCESLDSIDIPNSVYNIGYKAFNGSGIYANTSEIPGVVYAGNWVVESRNKAITTLDIAENTVGIADFAFEHLSALTDVTIPSSVKYVGNSAFFNTAIVNNVPENRIIYADKWVIGNTYNFDMSQATGQIQIIPIDVASTTVGISDYAFALQKIPFYTTIPLSVKSIGIAAFYGCEYLFEVNFPSNSVVEYIGAEAFGYCSSLTTFTLPRGLTRIDGLFRSSYQITQIIVPDTLEYIGDYTFAGCSALSSLRTHDGEILTNTLTIPDSVTALGEYSFARASTQVSIDEITIVIPDSVVSIGEGSFSTMSNLLSIVLPASITEVPDLIFYGNSKLLTVEFEGEVTKIGYGSFLGCYNFTEIILPPTVSVISERAFEKCYGLVSIVIPEGVTHIGDQAFFECTRLQNVVLPQTLRSIGRYAFSTCLALEEIVLPSGLEVLGQYAFAKSTELKSLTFSKDFKGMDSHVFNGCQSFIFEFGDYVSKLTFYIDDYMRPEHWSVHWNSSKLPVVWNCTLSEDKTYVVSFTNKENSITNLTEDRAHLLSAPTRVGYDFAGWSLVKGADYSDFANVLEVPQGATVYAIWLPEAPTPAE